MNNIQTNKIMMKLQTNFEFPTIPGDIYKHNTFATHNQDDTPEFQISTFRYLSTTSKLDIDKISISSKHKIFFCIYHINDSNTPFLEYLLYKYPLQKNDLCIFPFTKRDTTISIKKQITNFMKTEIKVASLKYDIKGYIIRNGNLYILMQGVWNRREFSNMILKRNNQWWWCLIDEICNQRRVANFPIHSSVTNLFLRNPKLIYLYGSDGKKMDIPRGLYYGTSSQLAPFYFVFGPKQTVKGRYGPYYYLGTYNKIIRYAGWSTEYKEIKHKDILIADQNGKLVKGGGIIRYAVFLGKLKVLLNHPQDDILQTTDILPDSLAFQHRLEDRDGHWAKSYNSLYYGRAKIKGRNERKWRINPGFVTKNFSQQIPLTMHILDKKTLKTNWDPYEDKYYIE